MGKSSSPARRRGSSTGKARSSDGKSEALPKWNEDALPSPQDKQNRAAYGDLLTRYDGLPDKVKHKLIKSELTGKAFDLRLSDILPADALKFQISGELYEELQAEIDELGNNLTSLSFMRVLLKSRKLPMSTRFDVAKEMLPYEHVRNPAPTEAPGVHRAALVIPGVVSIEEWERMTAEHRERTKKMENDNE
jgi:hypothetical protein